MKELREACVVAASLLLATSLGGCAESPISRTDGGPTVTDGSIDGPSRIDGSQLDTIGIDQLTDATLLADIPPSECTSNEDCTDPIRTACIGGRCVEPPGEAHCKEDAHCGDTPATPTCWMGVCIARPLASPPSKALVANQWTLLNEDTTGGRTREVFAFVPQLGRFVVAAGTPGTSDAKKLHYSTEHLELANASFENAYPPGAPATFKPASGPTEAPPHPRWGFPGFAMPDPAGIMRVPVYANAYGVSSSAYHQWVYAPDRRRFYAFMHNHTLSYEPATRTWSKIEASPTPTNNSDSLANGTRAMMWGTMGYDPIHEELVLVGGSGPVPGGSPGTWVFSLKDETWRRLALGSAPINARRLLVEQTRETTRELQSLVRNRLFRTESSSEATTDLAPILSNVQNAVAQLAQFTPTSLPTEEQEQGKRAQRHLAAAQAAATDATVSAATEGAVQALQKVMDALEMARYALAVEPPARAQSQLAYHRKTASLYLFGGDGMDRQYADTWSYDCATRRWSQRYPALSPPPRAGHAFVTLPKSDRLIAVGGYTLGNGHSYLYRDAYRPLAGQIWSYDPTANTWFKLDVGPSDLPKDTGLAPQWSASVNEEDVLVWLASRGDSRKVWAVAVDPNQIDTAGTTADGVAPETVLFRGDEDAPRPGSRSYDPAFYDKQPLPTDHVFDSLAGTIESNEWTKVAPPKGVEVAGWGTATLDTDRRQVLYWGGGHSEYKGTNVMHFSLASGAWSLSSRPDWVLEWSAGFLCPTPVSFNNRPMVPVHAYQAYAYDAPSQQMLAVSSGLWLFDVRRREWRFPPLDPPFYANVMRVSIESTPHGAVVWAAPNKGTTTKSGLYRFDGTNNTFTKLAMTGPDLGRPWCDGSGMAYDSKRDALWLAPGRKLFRYDFATKALTAIATTVPAVLEKYALFREQVYIPEADLVLLMRRFGPDGGKYNIAYDPTANKWYALTLPFDDGKERGFSWNAALMYDQKSKLVLLHAPISFWALKLDRSKLTLRELN